MKPMIVEFGFGTSLRRGDYTEASVRAVRHALWRNSINIAEFRGFEKTEMKIAVRIGVQDPASVDPKAVADVFPYGQAKVEVVEGGLDVTRTDGRMTVMAQAALAVGFEEAGADV